MIYEWMKKIFIQIMDAKLSTWIKNEKLKNKMLVGSDECQTCALGLKN
jgi:hypothetical protein